MQRVRKLEIACVLFVWLVFGAVLCFGQIGIPSMSPAETVWMEFEASAAIYGFYDLAVRLGVVVAGVVGLLLAFVAVRKAVKWARGV